MEFNLSYTRDEVYECGAALLTVLVCAKAIDDKRGRELYRSLCAKALWLKHLANPDDSTPITVIPQYVFRDRKIIDRDLGIIRSRLRERLIAGAMAVPFVREAKVGPIEHKPEGIKWISLNQIAEYPPVLEDAGQRDAQNLKKRFWAPSRPVMHLAAAVFIVGEQLRKGRETIPVEDFLFDGLFIKRVVWLGGQLQELIANDPNFPIKRDQLIPFRLD